MTDENTVTQGCNSLATELSARLGTLLDSCPASTNTTLLSEMLPQQSTTTLSLLTQATSATIPTPSVPSYIRDGFNSLMAANNGTESSRLEWTDPTTGINAQHGLYCLSSPVTAPVVPTLILATQEGSNLPCYAVDLNPISATSSTALTLWQAPAQSSNWMDSIPSLSNVTEFLSGCWQGCSSTLTHHYQALPPASSFLPDKESLTASLPSKETLLTLLAAAAPSQETVIATGVIATATLAAATTVYWGVNKLQKIHAEEKQAIAFAAANPDTEEGKAYYLNNPRRSDRLQK
jgi:hypothetical protein